MIIFPSPENPRCRICGKSPIETKEYEYIEGFEPGDLSEEDVNNICRQQEGTYNKQTGGFYCSVCYINIGMPLGKAP